MAVRRHCIPAIMAPTDSLIPIAQFQSADYFKLFVTIVELVHRLLKKDQTRRRAKSTARGRSRLEGVLSIDSPTPTFQ
jgi:hypothetical protein